jgi:energy-coupling factor transporter ATP-binding protein EcfA2
MRSTLMNNYGYIKQINEKLPTTFLSDNNIKELDFLFEHSGKKPNLSLLGQSGAGKSTLLNKLIGKNILESSNGKGAVTQYPVELCHGDCLMYTIYKNTDLDEHILDEIFKDKQIISEQNDMLRNDKELIDSIYQFIDDMSLWELPSESNKIRWKDFNKLLRGSKNKKYHFEYTLDTQKSIWINISPFIRKIVYNIPSKILEYVTLVDLPGLYDKSELRTKKTKEYLENETDFIMIVENNSRASSSSFIDKSLNNYIANTIKQKQIPDILMVITQIDNTYNDCKLNELSDDEDDEDDEDISDECAKIIKKEFRSRLIETRDKLNDDIRGNETLQLYNISSDNIHIRFCSSKQFIDTILEKNTIHEVQKIIIELCIKRIDRYENSIKTILNNHYTDIQSYVNKSSLQDEEMKKIKNIIKRIEETIHNNVTIDISFDSKLIKEEIWNNISLTNEIYCEKLIDSDETHGLTLWAILRKLNHESCDGETYNLIDDLSVEYIKLWSSIYNDYVNKIDENHAKNIKLQLSLFSTLLEINSITEEDIKQLYKSIKKCFINKDTLYINDDNQYISYSNSISNKGNYIINRVIRDNISSYSKKACLLFGRGSSDTCRSYIREMLSISNNLHVKDKIENNLLCLLNNFNNDIKNTFSSKIQGILAKFIKSYEFNNIDLDEINQLLMNFI